jgi:REP element-mobilizing transposase RayT
VKQAVRSPRIKEAGEGYYHVVSRIVDRRKVVNAAEKERFCRLMRATESFSGCRVLAYTVLDNHFHILLHVPAREPVGDEELLRRLGRLYNEQEVAAIREMLGRFLEQGLEQAAGQLRQKYLRRMYELSEFVKTLKQRYSQSYNRRHGRKGTLWEERFKSVLVGGHEGALHAVAAYIELNAVRAGIVADPKDYRFCSYAQALAGCRQAREGIGFLMRAGDAPADWDQVAGRYRVLLYEQGAQRLGPAAEPRRPGFSAQEVKAVEQADGTLPLAQLLRCRVRYFTDGAILGSRVFVEDAFQRHRRRFGAKRTSGARPMTGGDWAGLCTARRLRLDVVTVPLRL